MEQTVTLTDGVPVGDRVEHELVLRLPTAGDILDAQEEAERPVPTPQGWQLMASDTRVYMETLRRQVKKIGPDSGPMEVATLRKLSAGDLGLLDRAVAALDDALKSELAKRGRSEGAGTDDTAD